jgi:hypothetical protein
MRSFRKVIGCLAVCLAATTVTVVAGSGHPAAAASRTDFQMPFPCGQTWQGATREGHGTDGTHYALDFNWGTGSDDHGKAVVASAAGTAHREYQANGAGYYIRIEHGDGWATFYMHLSAYEVADGAHVEMGDLIGRVGNTGASGGAHLHYEQRLNGRSQYIYFDGAPLNPGYSFTYNGPDYTSKNCPGSGGPAVSCSGPVRIFQLRPGSEGHAELWMSSVSNAAAGSGITFWSWRRVYTFTTKQPVAVAAHQATSSGVYLYVTDADGGLRQYKYDAAQAKVVGATWLHNPDASSTDVDPYGFTRLTSEGSHLYGVKGGSLYLMVGLEPWQEPSSRRLVKSIGYPNAFYGDGDGSTAEVGYTATDGGLRYVDVRTDSEPTFLVREANWYRKSIASPGAGMLLQFRTDGLLWRQYIDNPLRGTSAEISDHKTLAIGTDTPNERITTAPNTCTRS